MKTAKLHGYNIEFQCDLNHTIVSDYKDKNFVNSSILQFPFGKGGINEMQQLKDGTYTKNVNFLNILLIYQIYHNHTFKLKYLS